MSSLCSIEVQHPPSLRSYGEAGPPSLRSYGEAGPPSLRSYGEAGPPSLRSYGGASGCFRQYVHKVLAHGQYKRPTTRLVARCLFFVEIGRRSAPMPPGPDLRGKREQRQTVFQFESPFRCFVPEQFHSDNSAWPTAERTQQRQGHFRYAPTRSSRSPFVEAERREGTEVHCGKPDDAKSVECIQAGQGLS